MATDAAEPRARLALLVAVTDAADPRLIGLHESLAHSNVEGWPVHVVTPGTIGVSTIEEVPLAFWETGGCDYYWSIDPDIRFLRPVTTRDLMASPDVPYAFLTEDAERAADPQTAAGWEQARAGVERIRAEVGLTDPRVRSSRHATVYSSRVAASFRDDFLAPRGMTYADAISAVPDAAGWYSAWLQVAAPESYVAREPIVLDVESGNRRLQMALRRETAADLARAFVAVRVPSTGSIVDAAPGDRLSRPRLVAERARPGELLRAAWLRIYRQLPSLQRLVARVRGA